MKVSWLVGVLVTLPLLAGCKNRSALKADSDDNLEFQARVSLWMLAQKPMPGWGDVASDFEKLRPHFLSPTVKSKDIELGATVGPASDGFFVTLYTKNLTNKPIRLNALGGTAAKLGKCYTAAGAELGALHLGRNPDEPKADCLACPGVDIVIAPGRSAKPNLGFIGRLKDYDRCTFFDFPGEGDSVEVKLTRRQ